MKFSWAIAIVIVATAVHAVQARNLRKTDSALQREALEGGEKCGWQDAAFGFIKNKHNFDNDKKMAPTKAMKLADCIKLCTDTAECKAFSFQKKVGQGKSPCWMKKSLEDHGQSLKSTQAGGLTEATQVWYTYIVDCGDKAAADKIAAEDVKVQEEAPKVVMEEPKDIPEDKPAIPEEIQALFKGKLKKKDAAVDDVCTSYNFEDKKEGELFILDMASANIEVKTFWETLYKCTSNILGVKVPFETAQMGVYIQKQTGDCNTIDPSCTVEMLTKLCANGAGFTCPKKTGTATLKESEEGTDDGKKPEGLAVGTKKKLVFVSATPPEPGKPAPKLKKVDLFDKWSWKEKDTQYMDAGVIFVKDEEVLNDKTLTYKHKASLKSSHSGDQTDKSKEKTMYHEIDIDLPGAAEAGVTRIFLVLTGYKKIVLQEKIVDPNVSLTLESEDGDKMPDGKFAVKIDGADAKDKQALICGELSHEGDDWSFKPLSEFLEKGDITKEDERQPIIDKIKDLLKAV